MVGRPEGIEQDTAWSMTLGKHEHRPPWPKAAGETAAWQIRRLGKRLRQAQVLVISKARFFRVPRPGLQRVSQVAPTRGPATMAAIVSRR